MLARGNLGFWVAGLVAVAVAFMALKRYFSPETRERRRRERSHGKVVSRKQGPWVKLAVKTKKSNADRGG
jgi:hypothetical protein